MNRWIKGIQASRSTKRSLRERRSLEQWERIRAEGKARFVRRSALTYGLTLVGVSDVCQHVFDGQPEPFILVKLFFYVLVGIFVASYAWSNREAQYQKALGEARAQSIPKDAKPTANLG